jgi:hypothetical protein
MATTTTIEISIENNATLHRIATQLEKILNKNKVSLNEVLGVLLAVKPLDYVLEEMMLEDGLEWQKPAKSNKKK